MNNQLEQLTDDPFESYEANCNCHSVAYANKPSLRLVEPFNSDALAADTLDWLWHDVYELIVDDLRNHYANQTRLHRKV